MTRRMFGRHDYARRRAFGWPIYSPKLTRRHRGYHLPKHSASLSSRSWVPGFRLGGAKPPPSLFGGD